MHSFDGLFGEDAALDALFEEMRKKKEQDADWHGGRTFSLIYPVLRYKIQRTYVGSAAQVQQARRDFDAAMREMEKKLEGQQYLVGGEFSRADLSVASMLSLLVMPPEHPFPWKEIPDPQTRAFYKEYREHPVAEWVGKMYRKHRLRGAGQDAE